MIFTPENSPNAAKSELKVLRLTKTVKGLRREISSMWVTLLSNFHAPGLMILLYEYAKAFEKAEKLRARH